MSAADPRRLPVWAPMAQRVEAVLGERRLPMTALGGGWWVTGEDVAVGSDYAFCLDSGEPLPDPRSRWQPAGVHGPSRLVEPARFRWNDDGWQPPRMADGLLYELHVGTFSEAGTFAGVAERLGHLVDLGVTHVELMPVAEFPGRRGWGYDGVDLYAPHHAYGGPVGLAELVDACHAHGVAVLLDVVYNHLGPSGNYLARFGPYFTDHYRTPWGDAVNLDDADSDEVRRFLIDNALMWLRDYHIDGLRLDAVHAIYDASAVHFLEQLAGEVDALEQELGRPKVLVAESDLNDPRILRPPDLGGYGIDAQWSDDFHHSLHAMLTGETDGYYADFGRLGDLAQVLRHAYRYRGEHSAFRRRRHGRPADGLAGDRFVVYLQNHDQVGNRAQGERSSALMSHGRLKVGAAVVLLAPFVPMLFQGEEWAASSPFLYFTDHPEQELGRAVSEGRREEFAAFGWDPTGVPDPQAADTFERSRLDWDELATEAHADLLAWHRALVALRRAEPDLADGALERVEVAFDEGARWLWFARGSIVVAFNVGSRPAALELRPASEAELLLASTDEVGLVDGRLELPADSVAVVRRWPAPRDEPS